MGLRSTGAAIALSLLAATAIGCSVPVTPNPTIVALERKVSDLELLLAEKALADKVPQSELVQIEPLSRTYTAFLHALQNGKQYLYIVGESVQRDRPVLLRSEFSSSKELQKLTFENVDMDRCAAFPEKIYDGTWYFSSWSGGTLFVSGGRVGFDTALDAMCSAQILQDGTLGPWREEPSMLKPRYQHSIAGYGGHLYVAGGNTNNSTVSNTVETFEILKDGQLKRIGMTRSMKEGRSNFALVPVGGHLVAIGGSNHGYISRSTEKANISGEGKLGPWQFEEGLPNPTGNAAVVLTENAVYLLGGHNGPFNSMWSSDIYAAKRQTPLDFRHTDRLQVPRFAPAAVSTLDGRIVVIGGDQNQFANTSIEAVPQ